MSGIGKPGRQPVWIAQQDEVLKTSITSQFSAEGRSRWEGGTKRLAHGGDRVQDYAGVTARQDDRVVRAKDAREGRVEM